MPNPIGNKVQRTISLPYDLMEYIEDLAKTQNRSVSNMLELVIKEYKEITSLA